MNVSYSFEEGPSADNKQQTKAPFLQLLPTANKQSQPVVLFSKKDLVEDMLQRKIEPVHTCMSERVLTHQGASNTMPGPHVEPAPMLDDWRGRFTV